MKQTKLNAFIEQVFNVGSGFLLSCLIWAYGIRPAIERGYLTIDDTLIITGVFTVVSVIRGYIWSRWFNHYNWRKFSGQQ